MVLTTGNIMVETIMAIMVATIMVVTADLETETMVAAIMAVTADLETETTMEPIVPTGGLEAQEVVRPMQVVVGQQ